MTIFRVEVEITKSFLFEEAINLSKNIEKIMVWKTFFFIAVKRKKEITNSTVHVRFTYDDALEIETLPFVKVELTLHSDTLEQLKNK